MGDVCTGEQHGALVANDGPAGAHGVAAGVLGRTGPLRLPRPRDHREPAVCDPGEVHLWSCPTDLADPLARRLDLLDDAERARADRFVFAADRSRYVQRRAFARSVLGRYLGMDPSEVPIRPSALGKPEIGTPCDISFNTSSSGDLAVVAVSRGGRVGVDIERVRHLDDALELAEGLFATPEIELLRSTPPGSRSVVFLSMWTAKESVVKAVGDGLHLPLDRFLVLAEGRVEFAQPDAGPPLHLTRLEGLGGYVGSVSAEGTKVTIRPMDSAMIGRGRG